VFKRVASSSSSSEKLERPSPVVVKPKSWELSGWESLIIVIEPLLRILIKSQEIISLSEIVIPVTFLFALSGVPTDTPFWFLQEAEP